MNEESTKKAIGYGISSLLFAGAAAVTAFLPDAPSWLTGVLSSVAGIANLFGVRVVLPQKKVDKKELTR